MKTYLGVPLGAAVFAGVLLTGGCVPKARLDEAMARNLRMDEQRKAALVRVRELEVANQKLGEKLQQQDAAISTNKELIASLKEEKTFLSDTIAELERRLSGLTTVSPPPAFRLPAPVDQQLKAFANANPDLVNYLPKYGMVKLKADLTFEKGSDFVQAEAEAALTKFVEILNTPDAANFNVYIAGHTDDIPIERRETLIRHPNNWYLSAHRAVAVQQILLKGGLGGERIGAMGFGEYHPIAPNKPNKRGNPVNRRVEIWIVPPDRFLTASGD